MQIRALRKPYCSRRISGGISRLQSAFCGRPEKVTAAGPVLSRSFKSEDREVSTPGQREHKGREAFAANNTRRPRIETAAVAKEVLNCGLLTMTQRRGERVSVGRKASRDRSVSACHGTQSIEVKLHPSLRLGPGVLCARVGDDRDVYVQRGGCCKRRGENDSFRPLPHTPHILFFTRISRARTACERNVLCSENFLPRTWALKQALLLHSIYA